VCYLFVHFWKDSFFMLSNLRERKKQEKIGWTTIPYPNNHFFQPSHIWSNLKFLNFFFFRHLNLTLLFSKNSSLSLSLALIQSFYITLTSSITDLLSHTHRHTHIFSLTPISCQAIHIRWFERHSSFYCWRQLPETFVRDVTRSNNHYQTDN